jgi:hypothetical protein
MFLYIRILTGQSPTQQNLFKSFRMENENSFEYIEDKKYFEKLLLIENSVPVDVFPTLFDFRSPIIKRKEFNSLRDSLLSRLIEHYGCKCMLNLDGCNIQSGIAVDHLIPLSSNKLNKEIRNLSAEKGRKVKTQSFGSNHINNLVIACNNCNNSKKHRILSSDKMNQVLQVKKF